jgi:hypothetical protein
MMIRNGGRPWSTGSAFVALGLTPGALHGDAPAPGAPDGGAKQRQLLWLLDPEVGLLAVLILPPDPAPEATSSTGC